MVTANSAPGRFGAFKDNLFKPPFVKRLVCMLLGVIGMGFSVAFLNMTNFGVDPCGSFYYGLSRITGISFGNIQVIMGLIFLLTVIFFDTSKLGFGTLGNMFVVGYTADFTTFVLNRSGIYDFGGFVTRVVVMLISLVFFVVAVAFYINAGLGAAAYDVMPNIVHEKLVKSTGKDIKFRYVRMSQDFLFMTLGFVTKGSAGVITILMFLTLGPTIEFVAKKMAAVLKL